MKVILLERYTDFLILSPGFFLRMNMKKKKQHKLKPATCKFIDNDVYFIKWFNETCNCN